MCFLGGVKFSMSISCSPQTSGHDTLLKITLIQLIEHGEIQLMLRRSQLLTTVHYTGMYSALYQRRSVNTNPITNPLINNGALPVRQ